MTDAVERQDVKVFCGDPCRVKKAELGCACAELDAAKQRIAELEGERNKLRKWCSVAAKDYQGMLRVMSESVGLPFSEAFRATAKELQETSEFMQMAAEGRADGTLYDDELSKTQRERDEAHRTGFLECQRQAVEECRKPDSRNTPYATFPRSVEDVAQAISLLKPEGE